MILAFDPGDTTGVAEFDENAVLQRLYQFTFDELIIALNLYEKPVSTVVVEDFILYAKRAKQQAGSRMKASQAIGLIKGFAHQKDAQVVMQPANIKPIAIRLTGIKMPTEHSKTHDKDAYLHGAYWLIGQGRLKSRLQIEMEAAHAD